jgi:hypothetical protein
MRGFNSPTKTIVQVSAVARWISEPGLKLEVATLLGTGEILGAKPGSSASPQ